jgi:tetratricopeptide (TPR) repeat protein
VVFALAATTSLSWVGCASTTKPSQAAETGPITVPRKTVSLDAKALAERLGKDAPPLRRIWPTLPPDVRQAVERRLQAFDTVEARQREIERRQESMNLFDTSATVSLAELVFLLEETAFGPPSPARTEALATLASLYGSAQRTADIMGLADQLARGLEIPRRGDDFAAFFKAFAEGSAALHRAFVAAVLREGAPPTAVSRALLAHASVLANAHDDEGALTMREAALQAFPAQPADAWLGLASAYLAVLDVDRAAIALTRSEAASVGTERPADLASRRAKLVATLERARSVRAVGTPKTAEERLALAETLFAVGQLDRAEPLFRESARELPDDARPIVGLAKLRFQRVEASDLMRVAREVAAMLEPARRLGHPPRELYELSIGLSGLTAFEDVLRGSREPDEMLKRATTIVDRLRALNDEQRAVSPERAAVLGLVLDLATEAIAKGPTFTEALPDLLKGAAARARALAEAKPTDPDARRIAITLSAFSANPQEAFAFVTASPTVPDEPAFVVTRAEIALDIGQSLGDAGKVAAARALVVGAFPSGTRRDARAEALLGDVEALLASTGQGSLAKAATAYGEALKGLAPADRARTLSNLAWVLAHTDKIATAPDVMREAVGAATKDVDRATAIGAMATFALAKAQPEDAVELATQAIALDEHATVALVVRALAKKRLGHPEEGRADALAAIARIEKNTKGTPHRQWGQAGVFGDASLDVNLGIASQRQVYDLRLGGCHRPWLLHETFDLAELRAIAATPAVPTGGDTKQKPPKKRPAAR